ncbi:MAG: hypothetical protein LH472_07500, partial [Pyrinomonadaceae bacterium]|nr:hypothetical protein [Pyrinomonadaceae bacterium]
MFAAFKIRDKSFLGYAVCFSFFALTIWAFYPGLMSPDSLANLTGGRENFIHDINSPVMSYLWGKLDRLVAGPALMFVLQNLVFWTAAAIFWRTTRGKSFGLATALISLGLLPQIL